MAKTRIHLPASAATLWATVITAWLVGVAGAADWPTFRHDVRRSGSAPDALALPLQAAWIYRAAQPPAPAWTPQPKLLDRTDYDYAPQLVVAAGRVYVGSSADDTVRALSVVDGSELWRYTAGGPVRLAPQWLDGRLYLAADDGMATCLDAATGAVIWTFQAAPWHDQMVGNRRMISRWPCRAGILAAGGRVYVAAGIWPSEGVYLYALDPATGELLWTEDRLGWQATVGVDMVNGNHQGEFGMKGNSPEGHMLYDAEILIVPQGQANPMRRNATDGSGRAGNPFGDERGMQWAEQMLAAEEKAGKVRPDADVIARGAAGLARRSPGWPGSGGTWATIDAGVVHVLAMHRSRAVNMNSWKIDDWESVNDRHADKKLPQIAKNTVHRTIAPGRISLTVRDGQIIARNAFDLVLAGEQLVLGHAGRVSVHDLAAADALLWEAAVEGEARGLAVADGRLFVSTHTGEIRCFAPAAMAPAAPTLQDHAQRPAIPELTPNAAITETLAALAAAQIRHGFALVLGDDTDMALALVRDTELRVVLATGDRARVAALRAELLDRTRVYGTRLHVVQLPPLEGHLPFAQYAFNSIIATDAEMLNSLEPRELYRVLRPCGGLLRLPGVATEPALALLRATGATDAEIDTEGPALSRAQIPGASDYNNPVADPHVKWPLQPLWYGGPNPMTLPDHRSGEEFASGPSVAYGVCLTRGETLMTCYDAYNGESRWTRPVPKLWGDLREYHGVLREVTDVAPFRRPTGHWRTLYRGRPRMGRAYAYSMLPAGMFDGIDSGVARLDPATGEQVAIAAPYLPGPVLSIAEARSWVFTFPASVTAKPEELPLRTDASRWESMAAADATAALEPESGMLTLAATDAGLVLTLRTADAAVNDFDLWELFFDFRPQPQRYGLYNRGTFALQVAPAQPDGRGARVLLGSGVAHPAAEVTGEWDATGTRTRLTLAWADLAALVGLPAGTRPESFGFAATLNAAGAADQPLRQRHLFGDVRAQGLNVGWADIYLGAAPAAQPMPTVIASTNPAQLDASWNEPESRDVNEIAEDHRTALRVHPLTGELGPRMYRTGTWACGGAAFSATSVIRRPTRPGIGIYDFADDGGLHFVDGLSMSCGNSTTVANGLLLYRDCRFRCDCNPSIKTNAALAPAERLYHETWSMFYEHPVRSRVRIGHINLGAFGDRRETPTSLWLAVPRSNDLAYGYAFPPGVSRAIARPHDEAGFYLRMVPAGMQVPTLLDFDAAYGPYRRNADRIAIANTERPWIYASGVAGLRRLTLTLDVMQPLGARPLRDAVTVDGALAEASWQEAPQATLPETGGAIHLRQDDSTLYIGVTRPPMVTRKGNTLPWTAAVTERDGPVWQDDALELFIGQQHGEAVLHLGLSASGAVFDALSSGGGTEDTAFNPAWHSAVAADDSGITWELALPLAVLRDAGLDPRQLTLNAMIDQSDTRADEGRFPGGEGRNWRIKNPTSESLYSLGSHGRAAVMNGAPLGLGVVPAFPTRRFTLRLHFAELEDARPGQRRFDVLLNGSVCIADLDVAGEAGLRSALVKELQHVELGAELVLEFRSKAEGDDALPPMLSALEIHDEAFEVPRP